MHLRGKFTKTGYLRLIGHLDLMRLFHRAIKRAKIDLKYSEGFNPSPKLSIPNPLPLGIESICEYIEFDTLNEINPKEQKVEINKQLPDGINLIDLSFSSNKNSLSNEIQFCSYKIYLPEYINLDHLNKSISSMLSSEKIEVTKKKKLKKSRKIKFIPVDIKPILVGIKLDKDEKGNYIDYLCHSGSGANLRADKLIEAISKYYGEIDFTDLMIIRTGQYLDINKSPIQLED